MSRRDAHGGGGGALAGPRLQEIELPALDGELDVLHVAEVPLEPVLRLEQLRVGARAGDRAISSMSSGVRIPATTSSPCALTRNSP